MEDKKALKLFKSVLSKTRSGAIDWTATAEEAQYVAPLAGKFTLKVWPYTVIDDRGNELGPPSVTLHDTEDNLLVDMSEAIDGITRGELTELSAIAKRRALKIDEQMDEAQKALDQLSEDIPF